MAHWFGFGLVENLVGLVALGVIMVKVFSLPQTIEAPRSQVLSTRLGYKLAVFPLEFAGETALRKDSLIAF